MGDLASHFDVCDSKHQTNETQGWEPAQRTGAGSPEPKPQAHGQQHWPPHHPVPLDLSTERARGGTPSKGRAGTLQMRLSCSTQLPIKLSPRLSSSRGQLHCPCCRPCRLPTCTQHSCLPPSGHSEAHGVSRVSSPHSAGCSHIFQSLSLSVTGSAWHCRLGECLTLWFLNDSGH